MCPLLFILIIGFVYPNFSEAQLGLMNLSVLDESGKRLHLSQLGGINQAQVSQADLNNDGKSDLFIFDRAGGHMSALDIAGTDSFQLHNEWLVHFPSSEYFMLLRDYNCDGLTDIFTYNTDPLTGQTGIKVYQGHIGTDQLIHFTSAEELIVYLPKSNINPIPINISTIDLPAIDDIDNDGDLDILNFASSGGHIEYFENRSVELGYGCDSLIYQLQDNCWGRIYESGISPLIDLSTSSDSCPSFPNWIPRGNNRHAGSTITTIDMNNDQVKDILIGDLSFPNINLLINGGTKDSAWIISQETNFPAQDIPIQIDIFPATFHVDLDLDGARDLLIAPNIEGNAQNRELWLYTNTGSDPLPDFEFTKRTTLIDQMMDLGSGSFPSVPDLNGDGMIDIVIGNDNAFINAQQQITSLTHLQNKGTQNGLEIQIQSDDFANLSVYGLKRLAPTWGDMDSDGDVDLIVGVEDGSLLYFLNTGSVSSPNLILSSANLANIDVGQHAVPSLFDLDNDGDLDLVVGERNGNMNLFLNQGDSANLSFSSTADTETFGFIDAREPGSTEGNAAPFLFSHSGQIKLALGSESGQVRLYQDIRNNLQGTFSIDSTSLPPIDVGAESTVAVADLDMDGFMEIIVGNQRGGMNVFQSTLTPIQQIKHQPDISFVYPNPADHSIIVDIPTTQTGICRFYNSLGQQIHQVTVNQSTYIQIKHWPSGSYVAVFESDARSFQQKFIKK